MMRFLLFSLLAFVAMCGVAAWAAPPVGPASGAPPATASTSPYAATVPVAGTGSSQRDDAMRAALIVVLHRVAPDFTPAPGLLAKAANYVRTYHYRHAASGNGLALEVEFDPGALRRLVAVNSSAGGAGVAAAAGSVAPPPTTLATRVASGTLWVDGIDNSHAFASLLAALRGDNALHDVNPVAAKGDGVLVHLRFDQSLASALSELTGSGGHLAPDPELHPGADMTLRWVP